MKIKSLKSMLVYLILIILSSCIFANDVQKTPERYITKLDDYTGSIDRVSPYHLYQHLYWNLRRKWRKNLYAWTRRKPCDASATISPTEVIAGQRVTLTLTITIGKQELRKGGRIAVYFPLRFGGQDNLGNPTCFQGPDGHRGYGSRITASCPKEAIELAVQIHSVGTVFTCLEIIIDKGRLAENDQIKILIGDPAYSKPQIVCERAKAMPFRVAIDFAGNGTFRSVKSYPTIKVVGAKAQYLRCFAPATPKIGEPFNLKVIAADLENHNPDYNYEGKLIITVDQGLKKQITAEMKKKHHGTITIPGVKVTSPGISRIQVHDPQHGLLGMSNPICPEMGYNGLKLFYGAIHTHTDLSDGVGTPDDCYYWARDVEGLDFAAISDHFEDGQSYNYTLEDKWEITKKINRKFNKPGQFVTLLGYEIGTVERHRNVYFSDDQGRMIVEGPGSEKVTMSNIFEKLKGSDYLLIPHAPKFHGINWNAPHNPETQRLVEICSLWGISEEGGPLSIRHALDLGYKFGFTGDTDSHCAEPGNPEQGGIIGVFAERLSRSAIFKALKARRTFASSGLRMIISFSINNHFMGEEFTLNEDKPRYIQARVVSPEIINVIEIIRNGKVVYSDYGNKSTDIKLEWKDTALLDSIVLKRELSDERFAYYYLRVKTIYGNFGWASPIWIRKK